MLDLIENGRVVPCHSTPSSIFWKNKSAQKHDAFVLETDTKGLKPGALRNRILLIHLHYQCKIIAKRFILYLYLSLVTRNPVFRVCDQVRHKPACSATEAS